MITFQQLIPEHLERLGKWREKDSINKYMLTSYRYDKTAQRKWYESLCDSGMIKYTWVVHIDNLPIGYLAISQIEDADSPDDKGISWGYYIGEDNFKQFGGIIPAYFYNYVFSPEFGASEVYADVFSSNKNVLKIHKNHGYDIDSRDKIAVDDGRLIEMVYMTLKRDTWLNHHQRWHTLKMIRC